jgi:hypothetical protein
MDRRKAVTNRFVVLAALVIGITVSAPIFAHHGAASFDTEKKVILKGTVKEWLYSNPHCLLTLEVKGEDGKVTEWITEAQAPNVMYPAGYRKNTFKPGDQVTVKIEPVKSGHRAGRIVAALTSDGIELGDSSSTGVRTGVTELK